MYVIKNAWRNITRAKGRNILMAIIAVVIVISCCVGLSINQAANQSRQQSLENLSITAQISYDRTAAMQNFDPGQGGNMAEVLRQGSGLSVDEMEVYANASSVDDFYYTLTLSMNGTEALEAVNAQEDSASSQGSAQMPGGDRAGGFAMGAMGTEGDFTLISYSSDAAMTQFVNGTSSVIDGSAFVEGGENNDCLISEELALLNDIAVGDTIEMVNPNQEAETYTLNVVGIYKSQQSDTVSGGGMMGFRASSDPANQIYLSYTALKAMADVSNTNAVVDTDEDTGRETTTAMPTQVAGTYAFASMEDYEAFESQVRDLGLSDQYAVSSMDLTSYEQSMVPLENLRQMAMYFLIVVLIIGAIVLIVLNIFNIRDRKYEVGVLTAVGMKKKKVALQFISEVFIVTMIAVVIGAGIGAAVSVPVTNTLLESQIASQNSSTQQMDQNFGRPMQGGPGGGGGQAGGDAMPNRVGNQALFNPNANYIDQVTSATDITVLLQLLAIGLGLTIIASLVSVTFIMRYEPLKILSNRD